MADHAKFAPVDLATVKPIGREFPIYMVNESEMDQLASNHNSVHFGLFGMGFGAFVSIGITWLAEATASSTPLSTRATAIFFSATVISLLFAIFCGLSSREAHKNAKRLINRIKKPAESSE